MSGRPKAYRITHSNFVLWPLSEQVKAMAEQKYQDEVLQKQMVTKNMSSWPSEGTHVCGFRAAAYRNRKDGIWRLSEDTSVLHHSHSCPVAGAKVKAKQLMNAPAIRASIIAQGGKAKAKTIRAEAAKMGVGGSAASDDTLWRAQRALRKKINHAWDAQWAEFGRYFNKLQQFNITAKVCTDEEGVFRCAFVAFPAARIAIINNGRGVCSTDFGHMKHDFFGGLNATGLFQLGDGSVIPLWSAIFAETMGDEDIFKWEWCARQIKESGYCQAYDNAVHFRDRHEGAVGFERILQIDKGK